MSHASTGKTGDVVQNFLTLADLLEDPQLARVYTHCFRTGGSTVAELMRALDLPQGSAYAYVNRLADAGVLEVLDEAQPRTYGAVEIDFTLSGEGAHTYTITPALIDAVGRRDSDDDVDAYVERHGIGGLATALSYAVERERGETTHRLVASDLGLSALEAEIILQALRPVVSEHYDVDRSAASLADVVDAEGLEPDSDDA